MSQDYIPLATVTLASATSTVTYTNIPATPYRDLVFILQIPATTTVVGDVLVRTNSDGGTNYSWVEASGNGFTTSSFTNTVRTGLFAGYHDGSNSAFITRFNLMDYSATDKHKTTLVRNDKSAATTMLAGRWANTAAVNRLDIIGANGNFPIGTTLNLYGIVA
jgi:hypothetical protein